jgi:hypothetical protein
VKCTTEIASGVSGHAAKVAAKSPDEQAVALTVSSDCDSIAVLEA